MNRTPQATVLMGIAELWALRATCSRLSVGAVVAGPDGRIAGHGYNGAPPGEPHCYHPPGNTDPCTVSVHAEANALRHAQIDLGLRSGWTMYTTHSPCVACAALILDAGVGRLVYRQAYRSSDGLVALLARGVEVSLL